MLLKICWQGLLLVLALYQNTFGHLENTIFIVMQIFQMVSHFIIQYQVDQTKILCTRKRTHSQGWDTSSPKFYFVPEGSSSFFGPK